MGGKSKGDNVEAEKKQFEVTIYYTSGNEESWCTAYLTENQLEEILSGQSKKFIRLKTRWQEEFGDDKDFYINPKFITEIYIVRELSKRESR